MTVLCALQMKSLFIGYVGLVFRVHDLICCELMILLSQSEMNNESSANDSQTG